MPMLTKDANDADLRRAIILPSPEAFRSIFADLFAVFFGLVGGWIAWAARRRAMRTVRSHPTTG